MQGSGIFITGAGVAPKEGVVQLLKSVDLFEQALQSFFSGGGLVEQMAESPAVEGLVVQFRNHEHRTVTRESR